MIAPRDRSEHGQHPQSAEVEEHRERQPHDRVDVAPAAEGDDAEHRAQNGDAVVVTEHRPAHELAEAEDHHEGAHGQRAAADLIRHEARLPFTP
jgi:hypothetical protein